MYLFSALSLARVSQRGDNFQRVFVKDKVQRGLVNGLFNGLLNGLNGPGSFRLWFLIAALGSCGTLLKKTLNVLEGGVSSIFDDGDRDEGCRQVVGLKLGDLVK